MVQYVALHTWEVPGSTLDPKTNHPDWGLLFFSSDSLGKCWVSALKLSMSASFHILPKFLFTVILSFIAV